MLIRDPHNAGATGLVRMWRELVKRDREVVAFLIDHHPCDYALGDCCVEFVSRNETQAWVEETYGKAGVNYLIKQVWLDRALMEDHNYKWVSGWTLVDAKGVDAVLPYFSTKAEAVNFVEAQGWHLNKGKFDDTI